MTSLTLLYDPHRTVSGARFRPCVWFRFVLLCLVCFSGDYAALMVGESGIALVWLFILVQSAVASQAVIMSNTTILSRRGPHTYKPFLEIVWQLQATGSMLSCVPVQGDVVWACLTCSSPNSCTDQELACGMNTEIVMRLDRCMV
jgi:hypothetical protein